MSSLSPEVLTVCRQDRERYLAVLMAPKEHVDALLSLVAYNQELVRAVSNVTEPTLGHIKLQWWIDAIPEICRQAPPAHPVAAALSETFGEGDVEALQALAQARTFDLQAERPQSLDELVAYAAATGGRMQALMAEILGADETTQGCAQTVGSAWALIGVMRALPYPAQFKRDMLPNGVTVRDVLSEAQKQLDHARGHQVARAALASVLIARLASRHLRRLERQNWDPARKEEPPAGVGSIMSLLWGKVTGRF